MVVILVDQDRVIIDGKEIVDLEDSFEIPKKKLKQQENGDFILKSTKKNKVWLLTQDMISPYLVTMQISIGDINKIITAAINTACCFVIILFCLQSRRWIQRILKMENL
jgi:hypothetical protein